MDEVVGSNPTRRTRFCYAGGRRDTDKNSPAPWRVRLSVHGPLTFNQVKVGSIPTRATNFGDGSFWLKGFGGIRSSQAKKREGSIPLRHPRFCAIGSAAERSLHMREVEGSNPSLRTRFAVL